MCCTIERRDVSQYVDPKLHNRNLRLYTLSVGPAIPPAPREEGIIKLRTVAPYVPPFPSAIPTNRRRRQRQQRLEQQLGPQDGSALRWGDGEDGSGGRGTRLPPAMILTHPLSQGNKERRMQERRKRSHPDGAEGSVADDGMKTISENDWGGTRAWKQQPQQEDVKRREKEPLKSSGKRFKDLDDYLRGHSTAVAVKKSRVKRKRRKFGGDGGGEVGTGSCRSGRSRSPVSDRGSPKCASGGHQVSSAKRDGEENTHEKSGPPK